MMFTLFVRRDICDNKRFGMGDLLFFWKKDIFVASLLFVFSFLSFFGGVLIFGVE